MDACMYVRWHLVLLNCSTSNHKLSHSAYLDPAGSGWRHSTVDLVSTNLFNGVDVIIGEGSDDLDRVGTVRRRDDGPLADRVDRR